MKEMTKLEIGEEEYEVVDQKAREDIESINGDIESINGDIESINKKINRKYIFISDSYGVESITGTTNWINQVVNGLGLTSEDYYSVARASRGFAPNSMVTETFLDNIKELEETITDKTIITDIVICGGCNDSLVDNTTIKTNINSFLSYCKTNYPNAKVYIGCIGRVKANYSNNKKIVDVVLPAYKDSVLKGAIYLNGVEYALRGIDCFRDENHPNDKGNEIISKAILNALLTGNANVHRIENVTITPSGVTNSITDSGGIRQVLQNGNCEFTINSIDAYMSHIGFAFSEPQTLSSTTLIEIGTFSDNSMFYGSISPDYFKEVEVRLANSSGALQNLTGNLCLGENKLYFRPNLEINPNSWGVAIEDIIKINFKPQTFNFEILTR